MIGASIEAHFGPYMQMPAASKPALSEALLEYVRAISSPIYIPNKSFRDRVPIPQVFQLNCVDDIITNLTFDSSCENCMDACREARKCDRTT